MEDQKKDENVTDNSEYIETIKRLKENSVSKEEYEKLKAENKQILNAYINDIKPETEEKKETVEELQGDLSDLKKDLARAQEAGMSNLEYVSKALKYRETAMKLGLQDPFVPNSPLGPDDNDFKTAQKVADKLQECVDQANGNPAVFRNLFEQAVRDDSKIPIKKK